MRTNLVREWRLSRVALYSVKVALKVRADGSDETAYIISKVNRKKICFRFENKNVNRMISIHTKLEKGLIEIAVINYTAA